MKVQGRETQSHYYVGRRPAAVLSTPPIGEFGSLDRGHKTQKGLRQHVFANAFFDKILPQTVICIRVKNSKRRERIFPQRHVYRLLWNLHQGRRDQSCNLEKEGLCFAKSPRHNRIRGGLFDKAYIAHQPAAQSFLLVPELFERERTERTFTAVISIFDGSFNAHGLFFAGVVVMCWIRVKTQSVGTTNSCCIRLFSPQVLNIGCCGG
mmetsp:Transcript_10930/g.22699  ORF Transcript_10930/g.22699 Transcript_10930/m.22699 type:complete len:208 (+) Transcript_10930:502-1125(+)